MTSNPWLQVGIIFAAPLGELFVIHRGLHGALGPNNLVLGNNARDILIPLFGALAIALWKGQEKNPLSVRLRRRTAAANGACLTVVLASLFQLERLVAIIGAEWRAGLILGGALATVGTGFFLWLDPREVLAKVRAQGNRLVLVAVALASILCYPLAQTFLWRPLTELTGAAVYALLAILGQDPVRYKVGAKIMVFLPQFSGIVTMGCAGFDGIFFFLFAYSLLQLFDSRAFPTSWRLYVGGTLFMFALNVIRISAFFVGANLIQRFVGNEQSRAFFKWAFHENVGWLLYLAGLGLFFTCIRRRFTRALRYPASAGTG